MATARTLRKTPAPLPIAMKSLTLEKDLAEELAKLEAADAERLGTILRGLLTCLQDLNQRLAQLEANAEPLHR